ENRRWGGPVDAHEQVRIWVGLHIAGRQRHVQRVDVAGHKRVGRRGIALAGDGVAEGVGLGKWPSRISQWAGRVGESCTLSGRRYRVAAEGNVERTKDKPG